MSNATTAATSAAAATTAAEPPPAIIRDQQLVLRVMRLARPKFREPTCWAVDPADATSAAIARAVQSVTGQCSVEFPVGEFLMAPQTIDVIYIGETFTFYVAVLNEASQSCTDVCIKAHIQTQTQRVILSCKLQDANAVIEPKRQIGEIFTHEITEVGQHILVCSVSYRTGDGEKMSFRKFFKFPVNQPIDVRTKFYNAEDYMSNDVYLEAQIQNLCTTSMILEKVVLDPSELYTSFELSAPQSQPDDEFLEPRAIRQYLFRLSPNAAEVNSSPNLFRGVSSIGILDMSWRTAMGERGRLRTSPLQRMAPGYGDLRLSIERIPRKTKVQEPFTVVCKLHNSCERSLDLVLTLDGSLQPSMIFCSVSGLHLGQVLPNNSIEFELEVLPIATGLQFISGIRLTDSLLRRTYEHDEIAQVLVV